MKPSLLRRLIELARPFTLVAPAIGFASGAVTAAGAAPPSTWTWRLLAYPAIGAVMAALLNAASNALNQIYDLEIDRVNKPGRPLTSGRLSIRTAWLFTVTSYGAALVLAWLVAPEGRHECFWLVLAAAGLHHRVFGSTGKDEAARLWSQTPRSRSREASCSRWRAGHR